MYKYTQHTCEAVLTKYEHHLQTKSDRIWESLQQTSCQILNTIMFVFHWEKLAFRKKTQKQNWRFIIII